MWEISDLNYLIFIFHNRNGHNHNIVAHSALCTQCVVFIKLSRRVKIIIIAQFCVFSFVTTTKLWDNLLRILNFIESFLFSLLLALSLCILSNKNHWIVLWKYSSWELVWSVVPNVCIHCFVRFLRMRLLCTLYMRFFFSVVFHLMFNYCIVCTRLRAEQCLIHLVLVPSFRNIESCFMHSNHNA